MSIIRDTIENSRGLITDTVTTDIELNDAAAQLVRLKTVDGVGSGLDSDLLRGLPADFTSSLGTSGYQRLPSGLIIQWGNVSSATGSLLFVTLPITFPNLMASVQTTFSGTAINTNVTVVALNGVTTGFDLGVYDNGGTAYAVARSCDWLAIGY